MDWSQYLFTAALALALYTGRQGPMVALAMMGNLLASMALGADPIALAVADWVAVALLIGNGRRANVAAALFMAMQPVYILGHYLGLQHSTLYALIDALAYLQLAVLGGWDVGVRRLKTAAVGFVLDRRGADTAALRHNAAHDMGRSVQVVSVDSRGLE